MSNIEITGNIVDIVNKNIFPGKIISHNGKISSIEPLPDQKYNNFILPGFIDSHIHIESSMLVPSSFARLACIYGTVATISDPHEIANILGVAGVKYMIEDGKKTPLKIYFSAPSCVPTTSFETAGASITTYDIEQLFKEESLLYLGEVMNYPGVIMGDPEVMKKIAVAKKHNKMIDGHAPNVSGSDLQKYIKAGISTDHECFELKEALEKIQLGMKVIIREGSAAKNYDTLHPLIASDPDMVMLCSDDRHPDDLSEGHINLLVKRAIADGHNLFDVLRCVSMNPVKHYGLDVGLLQIDDPADFIVVDNLTNFTVLQTYINGELVAEKGEALFPRVKAQYINNFKASTKKLQEFRIPAIKEKVQIIEALDGQLITNTVVAQPLIKDNLIISDPERDILKIAVVNRYENTPPAVALIKSFGLKRGALAASIAHDSHNVIGVGVSDENLCNAINKVIEQKGGIAISYDNVVKSISLPIAGLMTDEDSDIIAKKYTELDQLAKSLGSSLHAPFMTLSFMALLVIPKLKLSDKGLFDNTAFSFTDLQIKESPVPADKASLLQEK